MMSSRNTLVAASLMAAFLLSGCLLGPNFTRPNVKTPSKWVGAEETSATLLVSGPAVDLSQWWTAFNDPILNRLIERGINSNLDAQLAVQRLRQARAALGQAQAGFWPSLDFSASMNRTHTRIPKPEVGAPTPIGFERSTTRNSYRAGFDSVWEADIFGATRRSVESSRADLESTEENLRNVLVTLTAEIGNNYLDLRAVQEQLRSTRENLEIQKHSAGITLKRYQAGLASGLDRANAEAVVANTTAQIPSLESQVRQLIYRLSFLLGEEPGALIQELDPPKPYPAVPSRIPADLPATLLDRRPDIRAAEASLHSATARIGVAIADLLPRLTLSADANAQANHIGSWNREVTTSYGFGPAVSWNIFSGGLLWNRVRETRAVAEQALTQYQQAVLIAFQEVETAWTAYNHELDRAAALEIAVERERTALTLATQLYTEGQTDFLPVLVSEQALLNSQNALIQSRNNIAGNLVTLYKALGGGWSESAAATAEANTPRAFTK